MAANYEKVLKENLCEEAFNLISLNDNEFAFWLERMRWHVNRVNKSMDLFKKDEPKSPIGEENCVCPTCEEKNELLKDESSQGNLPEFIYCWRCGQKLFAKGNAVLQKED